MKVYILSGLLDYANKSAKPSFKTQIQRKTVSIGKNLLMQAVCNLSTLHNYIRTNIITLIRINIV